MCRKTAFWPPRGAPKSACISTRKFGAGLFGGEGFILQKLTGDGKAFVHAGGTIIEKKLNNELLRVDTGCVVAFEPGIDFSVARAGGLKSMIFGGEGLLLATLRGTGRVWLQSMPVKKLIRALAPAAAMHRRKAAVCWAACWAACSTNKRRPGPLPERRSSGGGASSGRPCL